MYVCTLYTRTRDILNLASRSLARSFKLLVASTRFRDISLIVAKCESLSLFFSLSLSLLLYTFISYK